jgi:M6 family metalloprotease-like protein
MFALLAGFTAKADYLVNVPQTLKQPNGEILHCLASGDEFYNWLHDENGFTIVQAEDGYYYYATKIQGRIVPSPYQAGRTNPAEQGLEPYLKIGRESYLEKRKAKAPAMKRAAKAPNNTGVLNAVTIYIRFADDAEFLQEDVFNQHNNFDGADYSLRNYFKQASYNQLDVRTTHIPANNTATISSYRDNNLRNYYRPYNATTNTIGYRNDEDHRVREWTLLRNAINWVRTNHPIPDNIDIDRNKDGVADLVCFIIKGNADGWNDMLWAHKWTLPPAYQTTLKGSIRVEEFAFEPEQQTSVRTLCHEAFHVLGSPDLYHYDTLYNHLTPVGAWDLMDEGGGHMLAYMKMQYGGWIPNSVPTLTQAGTYTLLSQGKTPSLFKIPGQGNEYFTVEYRQRTDDDYEANLPGSGLIVTRINSNVSGGNMNYNGTTTMDEVYVLRPGGTPTENGQISSAYVSDKVGRTAISKDHAIKPFYSNGSLAEFSIFDVMDFGDSIQFKFAPELVLNPTHIAGKWQQDSILLTWMPNSESRNIVLIGDTIPLNDRLENNTAYQVGNQLPKGATVLFMGSDTTFVHSPIMLNKTYYYRLFSNKNKLYSLGADIYFSTTKDTVLKYDVLSNFLPTDTLFYYWSFDFNNRPNPVFGHNVFGYSKFVERYTNNTLKRVHGLRFLVDKAVRKNSDASLYLSVWDVDEAGVPGRELSVEEVSYRDIININEGWTTAYFKNPPVVKSDFFIGLSIRYRTPLDTFALYATEEQPDRSIMSFIYFDNQYISIYERHDINIAYAYEVITSSGGCYVTTLPQWFNLTTDGANGKTIEVFSPCSDYDVVCKDAWIHCSVDRTVDRLTVDVDEATTGDRVGEILVIAKTDTARLFIYQGASVNVQEDLDLAVRIFPNPSKDGIFYVQSEDGELRLDVFDMMGRNIWSHQTFSGGEKIDLSAQKSGLYLLRVTKNGQQKTFKLIKQ